MPQDPHQRAEEVQKAVQDFVESLDKNYFRPLQKESYRCCAAACDSARTQADLQHRTEQCQQPVVVAQQMVSEQLQQFQTRLQRCAQRCQDLAQESLPASPSQKDVSKAEAQMESCINDCSDHSLRQIPKMQQEAIKALKHLQQ
mmetsp:Transcript_6672/g.19210  ORF Transcript_6672/g.19210 Transcript_6672/m.19210 type:complete len:144 (+) Transcript_6672:116-547(+)